MIESSLGITAAAHFTPLVDAADLDGAALTANDPFSGATIDGGQIRLPPAPGLGGRRRAQPPPWPATPRSSLQSPVPPPTRTHGRPPPRGPWCRGPAWGCR